MNITLFTLQIKIYLFITMVNQGRCSPPWKKYQRGDQSKTWLPPRFFKKFKRKPQRGDQRIFWLESRKTLKGGPREIFGLNLEMFLKNVSLGAPFEISIEFRQKSLKNCNFCWKKFLNKILGTSPKIVH